MPAANAECYKVPSYTIMTDANDCPGNPCTVSFNYPAFTCSSTSWPVACLSGSGDTLVWVFMIAKCEWTGGGYVCDDEWDVGGYWLYMGTTKFAWACTGS